MALIFPHEFIARTAIHAVKANLAKELQNRGMNNTEIAKLMQCQKSAISQYMHGDRGRKYRLSEKTMTVVTAVVEALAENPDEHLLKFGVSQICNQIIEEEYGYNLDDTESDDDSDVEIYAND
tara:strand:- start:1491 stop:1859 length:369 start_codon:yes stop_codon:yes gene_type:complete